MSRTILLFLSVLASASCTAQDLDSLRHVWTNTSLPDTTRFLACYDLVWDGYLFSDPDSALLLAEELQATAREKRSAKFDALAYDLQAAAWYVKGDMRKALSIYAISLPMHEARGDVGSMADVIGNMGSMHSFLGEHKEALALYEKALRVHTERHDTLAMANDINAIGRVHMVRGDHARAAQFYKESLVLVHAIGNDRAIATGLSNLGSVHFLQGDYAAAIPRFTDALQLAERLGDKDQQAQVLAELGTCHAELGDHDRAMELYRKALAMNEQLGDQRGIVMALNKMADLLREKHDAATALPLYRQARTIAAEHELAFGHATALVGEGSCLLSMGRTSAALEPARQADQVARDAEDISLERDAAQLLYEAYRAMGNSREALTQHERYVMLNDSLIREENQREALRNQFAYDQERRILSDSLKHQAETNELNLAHAAGLAMEQERRTWLMAAVLIAGLVSAGIWWRLRHAQRTNQLIREAQARVVEAERQRENEAVRTRIARDLHDEMGGELTKISLLSAEAGRQVPSGQGTLSETLTRIAELSRSAHGALHDVVHATDASTDSSTALVEQARTIAHRLLDNSPVQHTIDVEHSGADVAVGPATKRDLLMILKEAINNALKHAQAQRIEVSFRVEDGHYQLEVADDGKGFDPTLAHGGNGLRNMRDRAIVLGADIRFSRGPGLGSAAHVTGTLSAMPTTNVVFQ